MVLSEGSDLQTLVTASRRGDDEAWSELVRRYTPLVMAVTRGYRLSEADAQDVRQTLWLRLVEHLDDIREPVALPGWIASTVRHECIRCVRAKSRTVPVDPLTGRPLDGAEEADIDAELIRAERHQALRDGLAELPAGQRRFLAMLAADPPYSYGEISRTLGMPIGSIGPTRARVLNKLRDTTAIRNYMQASREAARTGGDRHAIAELE